jgi:hypothetical protein
MKLVFRTLFFHILCIIIFAFLYYKFREDFKEEKEETTAEKNKITIIDSILLSTTIQAGVGISNIYPQNFYGKIILIIQQMILIMTHLITLYIFTL